MTEAAVKTAAKLYHARDAMRTVLRDRYAERCREWMRAINFVMQRHGCSELQACVHIAKDCEAQSINTAVLFATVVEMSEGIFALPPLGAVVKYRATQPAQPGKVVEGAAVVVQYMTAENAPSPHMRPAERMLYVRECGGGSMQGKHHIIKASEVVQP